jgi:hypothetical protein
VHLIDRLEARSLTLLAAGAEVDPEEERRRFDAALAGELDPEDAERGDPELRRALGLR